MKPKSTAKTNSSGKKPIRAQAIEKGEAAASKLPNGVGPDSSDVMTLAEAAAFLRVLEDAVATMALAGSLPARRVAKQWRFLRSALCEWLGTAEIPAILAEAQTSKQRMMGLAGIWKDDESIPEMIENIYRERKRHLVGGK